MSTRTLSNVKRIESAEGIPDGEYEGLQNEYTVSFETKYGRYEGKAFYCVWGSDVPCKVRVKCGRFEVGP
mgnify:CR=1 FL=1